MRTLAIATIIAALAATPAFAQDVAGSNKHHGAARKKSTEQPKTQADDKGYKSAIDRLPDQKYDPWGTARSSSGGDKPR